MERVGVWNGSRREELRESAAAVPDAEGVRERVWVGAGG